MKGINHVDYSADYNNLSAGELDGDKQCPMNNCGNPIADDESSCGEH